MTSELCVIRDFFSNPKEPNAKGLCYSIVSPTVCAFVLLYFNWTRNAAILPTMHILFLRCPSQRVSLRTRTFVFCGSSLLSEQGSEQCQRHWQQLRWTQDVWRWGAMFEPAGSFQPPCGWVNKERRVMYYLEVDLPLCSIRARLREAVMMFCSSHAQKRMSPLSSQVNLWPPCITGSIHAHNKSRMQEMHRARLLLDSVKGEFKRRCCL